MRCLTEAAPHMARQEACEKYKVACVLYPQAEGAFAELDVAISQSVDRCLCHPPTLQKDPRQRACDSGCRPYRAHVTEHQTPGQDDRADLTLPGSYL